MARGQTSAQRGHDAAHDVAELALASPRGAIALSLAATVLFFHLIDRQIMAILAEPIKADLGLSDTQLGLLTGLGFSLLYSILGIPLARLADRLNRVHIVSIATAVWSGMTMVTGLASSFATMLFARMGVAAGEAGGIPPLHSLIADLFAEENRARAFAIMQLGGPLGVLVAYLAGGYLVAAFDWRTVFFAAGGLGLVLAPVLLRLMPEPRRQQHAASQRPAPFWTSIRSLFSQPAYLFTVLGIAFAGMGLYATILWAPSFLIRSFTLPIGEVGLILGTGFGVLGVIAVLTAGQIADWAQRLDVGAHARVPALMMLVAAPLSAGALLSSTLIGVISLFVIPIMMMSAWQVPALAAIQNVAAADKRALASALAMFVLNLVGLGLGPLCTGVLSDALSPKFGAESLRYALLLVPVAFAFAALFWLLAAQALRRRTAVPPVLNLEIDA